MIKYPIPDPVLINHPTLRTKSFVNRVKNDFKFKVNLAVVAYEVGWVFTVENNEEITVLGMWDGITPRTFRSIRPMREVCKTMDLAEMHIPMNSDRLRAHHAFMETRQQLIQQRMKKKALTTTKLGAQLDLHNNYVSSVIRGITRNQIVEETLSDVMEMDRSDLFPDIPDHIV